MAAGVRIPPAPVIEGAVHLHSGKVRDLYRLEGGSLLMVASDRISAYDFVLETPVPDKGRLLTAMSLWWFERLADLVPHHVLSTELPAGVPAELQGRAVVCEPLEMYPVECVARGYLTGSGLADYRATGQVCGVPLPDGLVDGSRLDHPVFTPATKAAVGDHDENVSYAEVAARIGEPRAAELRDLTLLVYGRAESVARERGIILADTKLEFGARPDGTTVLADEVLTPDSSRFWPADAVVEGTNPPSFDKQPLRDWLESMGWGQKPPPPTLPAEAVDARREPYTVAYERLSGPRLADWPGVHS